MQQLIENNKFYKTFTAFITDKTITAEKTINGRKYPPENNSNYKFGKEFYNNITAGGLLLIPATVILLSKKNLHKLILQYDKDIFKITNGSKDNIFSKISKSLTIFKQNSLLTVVKISAPLRIFQHKFAKVINTLPSDNYFSKIYKSVNGIFINAKASSAKRQCRNLMADFDILEKNISKTLKILSNSENGKIRIMLPKELTKINLHEQPVMVNLNKTSNGLNRADETKKILEKIKATLTSNITCQETLNQLTYTCEDIFNKTESTIISFNKILQKLNLLTPERTKMINDFYNNLTKYRFAEMNSAFSNATPIELRATYVNNMKNIFTKLKDSLPDNPILFNHISKLEELLYKKTDVNEMGLLEKLRFLLKCDDIQLDCIKDGKKFSYLKQYQPENYIKLKNSITQLSKSIRKVNKLYREDLPANTREINAGGIFAKILAILLPTIYIVSQKTNNKSKSNKESKLFPFIIGSLAMLYSQYYSTCSKKLGLLLGIGSSYLTSNILHKLIVNKNNLNYKTNS